MGQCANTIPWIVNYALTAFSLIILSINLKLVMQIYEKYIAVSYTHLTLPTTSRV